MALFTRLTPTPTPTPGPETWTPEGTLVSQRYRALERATVLVYTADTHRGTPSYAAACLGCTYRADRNTSGNVMKETDAAQAANTHAAACRSMPRGVPTRPSDTEAAELIRTPLWNRRYSKAPRPVHLSDFNRLRVDVQRSTNWIKTLLTGIAQTEPSFLTATPTSSGEGTRFTVQPFYRA
ncbi:hypothetical protein [Streptomyces sp. N2A]|uniref:hypothetical protein n=1 Tax=Streptomyces sp. N2A TaxID=3073936 RepID=UPI0028708B8D|nr:hypothetical protein [Streptomyces sp. N2A]